MTRVLILSFLLVAALWGLADCTASFNKGTKIGTIVARETARQDERLLIDCDDDFTYRPITGLCNNLDNAVWGAPMQPLRRILSPQYDDGAGDPRIYDESGDLLPSAREASVACFPSDSPSTEDAPFSQMVMQWGQFVDHDFSITPGTGASNCCSDMGTDGVHPDFAAGGNCLPILIPANDRQFTDCMEFSRSKPTTQTTATSQREQFNALTSYLDASMVYGSSQEELDDLRETGGSYLMKTSSAGTLLPTSNTNFCMKTSTQDCFNGGDIRLNVFPGLVSVHTLFVLEHNRVAEKLSEVNPSWSNEIVFQEARKIVIASIQHITYDVYLRATVGSVLYDHFGFSDTYEYDESVNPGIYNSFATAAFRHGHSQIRGDYGVQGDASKNIVDLYMRPSFVYQSLDDVLLGIIDTANQKADDKFTPGVTDHLFENTSSIGVSLDLGALNIQRGRDHGLASYCKWSEIINDTTPLTSNPTMPTCAVGLYDELCDVDLYVGAMTETPLSGAMVGPTFGFIIGRQFRDLRDGDRFWYETSNTTLGFSTDQLSEIRDVTLARIICDNTGITNIQPDVFKQPQGSNTKVACSTLDSLDFSAWKV